VDHLLVAAYGREPLLELTQYVVGPEKPDRPQDPKETKVDPRAEMNREAMTTRSTKAAPLSR
jgi:hypothetical protein